jgi:hypothetical protein
MANVVLANSWWRQVKTKPKRALDSLSRSAGEGARQGG